MKQDDIIICNQKTGNHYQKYENITYKIFHYCNDLSFRIKFAIWNYFIQYFSFIIEMKKGAVKNDSF